MRGICTGGDVLLVLYIWYMQFQLGPQSTNVCGWMISLPSFVQEASVGMHV